MPENLTSTPDGSLRLAVDELGKRLLATGKPEQLEKLKRIVALLDIDPADKDSNSEQDAAPDFPRWGVRIQRWFRAF